jgi:hypothetical protein
MPQKSFQAHVCHDLNFDLPVCHSVHHLLRFNGSIDLTSGATYENKCFAPSLSRPIPPPCLSPALSRGHGRAQEPRARRGHRSAGGSCPFSRSAPRPSCPAEPLCRRVQRGARSSQPPSPDASSLLARVLGGVERDGDTVGARADFIFDLLDSGKESPTLLRSNRILRLPPLRPCAEKLHLHRISPRVDSSWKLRCARATRRRVTVQLLFMKEGWR